jgi:ankyrin repeat protein
LTARPCRKGHDGSSRNFGREWAETAVVTLDEVFADFGAFAGSGNPVSVTTRGPRGETALHWMATLGDVNAIRLLVTAGADLSAADREGNTPLHEAVRHRQARAVQLLVELGADPHIRNHEGKTSREIAEGDAYAPTIELLARD